MNALRRILTLSHCERESQRKKVHCNMCFFFALFPLVRLILAHAKIGNVSQKKKRRCDVRTWLFDLLYESVPIFNETPFFDQLIRDTYIITCSMHGETARQQRVRCKGIFKKMYFLFPRRKVSMWKDGQEWIVQKKRKKEEKSTAVRFHDDRNIFDLKM